MARDCLTAKWWETWLFGCCSVPKLSNAVFGYLVSASPVSLPPSHQVPRWTCSRAPEGDPAELWGLIMTGEAEPIGALPSIAPCLAGNGVSPPPCFHAPSVSSPGIGKVELPCGITATAGAGPTFFRAAFRAASRVSKPTIPQVS